MYYVSTSSLPPNLDKSNKINANPTYVASPAPVVKNRKKIAALSLLFAILFTIALLITAQVFFHVDVTEELFFDKQRRTGNTRHKQASERDEHEPSLTQQFRGLFGSSLNSAGKTLDRPSDKQHKQQQQSKQTLDKDEASLVWQVKTEPPLPENYVSIFDAIYNAKKHKDFLSYLLASLVSNRNDELDRGQSVVNAKQARDIKEIFNKSLDEFQNIDDDFNDEEFDRQHPMKKNKPEVDSGPPCLLFRYVPNCSCSVEGVKGGSMCALKGVGRCANGACYYINKRVAQTVVIHPPPPSSSSSSSLLSSSSGHRLMKMKKITPDLLRSGTVMESTLKNYYFGASIAERIDRTKSDLRLQHQDYFLKKINHLCRIERMEMMTAPHVGDDQKSPSSSSSTTVATTTSSSSPSSSMYRCRSETYPSNPTLINEDFLRNKRTNSSLIYNLYKKHQPMFIRLYCTVDSRMGITNVELSLASCLAIAVDLMTRDSSIVVDVVMPAMIDHRDYMREWLVDVVDFRFLEEIAKTFGIHVMVAGSQGDWTLPQLYPDKKSGGMNLGDGCESCIWRESYPVHCIGCCVADSRLLAGSSLMLNTASSWAERSLPIAELFRQDEKRDPKVNVSNALVVKDDDVYFSVFRIKNMLQEIYNLASLNLPTDLDFTSMTKKQLKERIAAVRSLAMAPWYTGDDRNLINRYRAQRQNRRHPALGNQNGREQKEEEAQRRGNPLGRIIPRREGGARARARDIVVAQQQSQSTTSTLTTMETTFATTLANTTTTTTTTTTTVDPNVADNQSVLSAPGGGNKTETEVWNEISTADQDWNWCVNKKLARPTPENHRFLKSRHSEQQRVLVVDDLGGGDSDDDHDDERDRNQEKTTTKATSGTKPGATDAHNGTAASPAPKNNNKKNKKATRRSPPPPGSKKHQVRVGENYFVSIRVTGLHFTTFLEERSATWLPTLDWLQPSKKARMDAQRAIDQILRKSVDGKTFLAVHLRYEEDAFVWTVGVHTSEGNVQNDDEIRKAKNKQGVAVSPVPSRFDEIPESSSAKRRKYYDRQQQEKVSKATLPSPADDGDENEKQHNFLERWRNANKDRVGGAARSQRQQVLRGRDGKRRDKADQNTLGLMAHMKKLMDQIDKLSQDLNVGAVFISNAAPIEEYHRRFENDKGVPKKHRPWFTGASFFDKTRERTRYGSLVDRIIVESATVGVVWDPFTGLSSFSQKIFDHRCRRMKGLTTFSYSIGVGRDRDSSLVLEC